jgi:hypothetical protein
MLIFGFSFAGCSKQQEIKSQPSVPVASGDVIHAVWREEVVPANGMLTNYFSKAHIFTEGYVAIYDSGLVIISDLDGTKHGARIADFVELTFR